MARTLLSDLKSIGVKVSKTSDIFSSFGLIDQDDEVASRNFTVSLSYRFGQIFSAIRKTQMTKDRS